MSESDEEKGAIKSDVASKDVQNVSVIVTHKVANVRLS